MDPVCNIGDRIKIKWIEERNTSNEVIVKGIIRSIDKCEKKKCNSWFKYTIDINNKKITKEISLHDKSSVTNEVLKTRLLHLDWKLLKSKRKLLDVNVSNDKTFSEVLRNKIPRSLPTQNLSVLDSPTCFNYIVAPMVGGSELAFRILCRRYGATLAYTPMMNSERFAVDEAYRNDEFQTNEIDRPLVAHFSGNNPQILLQAAKHIEHRCDAIDLNLGCPQRIAHSGHFGSFLLDDEDRPLVLSIIETLSKNLSIPVFVKIRLLKTLPETIQLCQQLVASGASLIAIHARHRVNLVGRTGPGAREGAALLDQVTEIRKVLPKTVKIIANGNVITWNDVVKNKLLTQADGIMSAEGLLDNPALFYNSSSTTSETVEIDILRLGQEYMELVKRYPVKLRSVIFHIRRMCKDELMKYQLMEDCLNAVNVNQIDQILTLATAYQLYDINGPSSLTEGGKQFQYDAHKAKKQREALERKKHEEGKRKEFEARMVRKAKREGKELDFYLKKGLRTPMIMEIQELKAMDSKEAFEKWKFEFSQHCYNYHFGDPLIAQSDGAQGGCARGRKCSFLHCDAVISNADDSETGFIAG